MRLKLKQGFFIALSLLLLSPFALADREDDRDKIHELMWRYARALDTFNPEAYAAVFTVDGEFRSSTISGTKGRNNLKAMVDNFVAGRKASAAAGNPRPGMYHMTTDRWIEFIDDTHAKHHSYWITFYDADENNPPTVGSIGRAIDELVKVNGKWLIELRNVAPKD